MPLEANFVILSAAKDLLFVLGSSRCIAPLRRRLALKVQILAPVRVR